MERGREKGAVYVHIPFCRGKCTFCILTKEPPVDTSRYVNMLLEEARAWSDYFSPVETLYVGGGTPTSLSPEELRLLFNGLRDAFHIEKDAEVSIETTATELTEEKMNLLAELGVNRVSVGVQTFNQGLRQLLGRRSSVKEVIKKLNSAREVFPLLTIDLLYDLPGQRKRDLIADLQIATGIGIDGISLYPLIYSPRTVIARQFKPPPLEMALDSFRTAKSFMEDNGYHHININHFSNGRDEFRYSTYFNSLGNVLGLGAGATGFIADCFIKHPSKSEEYSQDRDRDRDRDKGRVGTVFNVPEKLVPALWCVSQIQYGRIDIEEPRRRWGFEPLEAFASTIEKCVDRGEMMIVRNILELTTEGIFWANTIGAEMAMEYLYKGRGELLSLEDNLSKIVRGVMPGKIRSG